MFGIDYKILKHCRWCGKGYYAKKPIDRDGFCCKACKQAHYRAYKKWVTARRAAAGTSKDRTVTQKTPKKGGKRNGKVKKKQSR